MSTKDDLKTWILQALKESGGSADILTVAEHLWREHESDLRSSGRLFYTWQYDMRWAALELRKAGAMRPTASSPIGTWELA